MNPTRIGKARRCGAATTAQPPDSNVDPNVESIFAAWPPPQPGQDVVDLVVHPRHLLNRHRQRRVLALVLPGQPGPARAWRRQHPRRPRPASAASEDAIGQKAPRLAAGGPLGDVPLRRRGTGEPKALRLRRSPGQPPRPPSPKLARG